VGEVGDLLQVSLAVVVNDDLEIKAEILRVSESDEGDQVAVRFLLDDRTRPALERALDRMMAEGGDKGARKRPRLSRRMGIQFGDAHGMIENISEGGLSMMVEKPLKLGAELELSLPAPGAGGEIKILSARVVHQKKCEDKHLVGLQFVSMRPEARERLEALLAYTLDAETSEEPDSP
jgi:hypothetical protein